MGGTRRAQSETKSHHPYRPSLQPTGYSLGENMEIMRGRGSWKRVLGKLHAPTRTIRTAPKTSVMIRKYGWPNLANKDDTSFPLSLHLQEPATHRHFHSRGIDVVSALWQTALVQLYGGPDGHARSKAKSGAAYTTSPTDLVPVSLNLPFIIHRWPSPLCVCLSA